MAKGDRVIAITRRRFAGLTVSAIVVGSSEAQIPQFPAEHPPSEALQPGDFLWPKGKQACVFFSPAQLGSEKISRAAALAPALDRLHWEEQRADFLSNPPADAPADAIATYSALSYEEFRADYDVIETPYGCRPSAGSYSVGHVAIVDVSDGEPMIIEAIPKKIVRKSYADWSAGHRADFVFHGRLKQTSATSRQKIAEEARRHIGTKYSFFNFDLLNNGGFYCSKLAWAAVWRATGIALDGNRNPKRWVWFSPKQLYYCDTIDHLNSAGNAGEYAPPRGVSIE